MTEARRTPPEEGTSDAEVPRSPGDAFRIALPNFEGPLDLLLHLIREHRLDIFDIPIALIVEKYLEYLERMRELNLDIAGEFLVMASTLAHLKSRLSPTCGTHSTGNSLTAFCDSRLRTAIQFKNATTITAIRMSDFRKSICVISTRHTATPTTARNEPPGN